MSSEDLPEDLSEDLPVDLPSLSGPSLDLLPEAVLPAGLLAPGLALACGSDVLELSALELDWLELAELSEEAELLGWDRGGAGGGAGAGAGCWDEAPLASAEELLSISAAKFSTLLEADGSGRTGFGGALGALVAVSNVTLTTASLSK